MKRKKITRSSKHGGDEPSGESNYAKKGTEFKNKKTIKIKATGHSVKIHKGADTYNLEHGEGK